MRLIIKLDQLCHARVIGKALEDRIDLKEFTEGLNHFIHGYGSLGYEEAESFNLMVERKYTEQEAEELLKKIIETRGLKKSHIYIAEIDEVPWSIAWALERETGGGDVSDTRNTQYRYGIIRGHELVGFVSGNIGCGYMNIKGLYIRKDYRRQGLSTKLLEIMMNVADREDLKGLWMGNASWKGQDALRALKRHYDREGNTNIVHEEFSEDLSNKAGLYFKDRIE